MKEKPLDSNIQKIISTKKINSRRIYLLNTKKSMHLTLGLISENAFQSAVAQI